MSVPSTFKFAPAPRMNALQQRPAHEAFDLKIPLPASSSPPVFSNPPMQPTPQMTPLAAKESKPASAWSNAESAWSKDAIVIDEDGPLQESPVNMVKKKRRSIAPASPLPPVTLRPPNALGHAPPNEPHKPRKHKDASSHSLATSISLLAAEKSQLQEQTVAQQSTIDALRGEIATKATQVNDLKAKVTGLGKFLEGLARDQDVLRHGGDHMSNSLADLAANAEDMRAEFGSIKSELDSNRKEAAEFERQDEINKSLRRRCEELVGQLIEERDRVGHLDTYVAQLRSELAQQNNAERESLIDDLNKRELMENEIQSKLVHISSKLNTLGREGEFEDLKAVMVEKMNDVQSIMVGMRDMHGEAVDWNKETLHLRLRHLQDENSRMTQMVQDKESECSKLEVAHAELEQDLTRLTAHRDSFQAVAADLELANATKQAEIQSREEQLAKVQAAAEALQKRIESVEGELAAKERSLGTSEKATVELSHRFTEAEKELNELRKSEAVIEKEMQEKLSSQIAAHEIGMKKQLDLQLARGANTIKQRDNKIAKLESELANMKERMQEQETNKDQNIAEPDMVEASQAEKQDVQVPKMLHKTPLMRDRGVRQIQLSSAEDSPRYTIVRDPARLFAEEGLRSSPLSPLNDFFNDANSAVLHNGAKGKQSIESAQTERNAEKKRKITTYTDRGSKRTTARKRTGSDAAARKKQ